MGAVQSDSFHHLQLTQLEAGLRALPEPPRDFGRLTLMVRRRPDGVRETPQRVLLNQENGMPGDDWSRRPTRHPETQLSVMRCDVAMLIANGQPLTVFGDNVFVNLDVSAANLPVGSRLRVGEALVEVTPQAHNGCVKFQGRFGQDAHRFVQAAPTRHLNLRGIFWRVVASGEVRVGVAIQVLSRSGGVGAAVTSVEN